MKKKVILSLVFLALGFGATQAQELPDRKETLKTMVSVNGYFMKKYADYRTPSFVKNVTRPSNIWTRGVTGYAPNEYIRIVRMKKAAELLRENRFKVAEVSYRVGINDPFYFSKCFKRQFGVSPSAYVRGTEETEETANEATEE